MNLGSLILYVMKIAILEIDIITANTYLYK